MARLKPIYSEGHDASLFPQKKKRGRRRASSSPPPVNPMPSVPNTQIGFLPPNLSDEQRISLRARQLMADRDIPRTRHSVDPVTGLPIPHHDRLGDPDLLDVPRPRGPQDNLVDGNTVFQNMLGPKLGHEPRVLSDPDLEELAEVNSSRELIAAVSAEDAVILAFDNELSTMHTTLRRLRQKAQQMAQSVARQDDDPGSDNSPTSHAQNVVQLIATILEPWFMALDDEFSQLLNATEQGRALEEAE